MTLNSVSDKLKHEHYCWIFVHVISSIEAVKDGQGNPCIVGYGHPGPATSRQPRPPLLSPLLYLRGPRGGTLRKTG